MDKIKEYLSRANPDFDEGFKLLEQNSKNRRLLEYLRRKRVQSKLLYELGKIAGIKSVSVVRDAPKLMVSTKPISQVAMFEEKDLEGAPEIIKQKYQEVLDAYTEQRGLHSCMRVAVSDEERAKYREQLLELDGVRKQLYAELDNWKSTGVLPNAPADEKKYPTNPLDIAKNFNLAAANLSRNLNSALGCKDEAKRQKYVDKVVEFYTVLKNAGHSFKEQTLEKLAQVIDIEK